MIIKKYLPYLAGVFFSSIFGFSFLFTKEVLDIIQPFHLLALRFSIAAIILLLLYLIGIIKLDFNKKDKAMLIILAVVQPGLYFIFETLGIQMTSSSEAGMMIALIPVVVSIFAFVFLGEKTNKEQVFFVLLSVFGVVFIVFMRGNIGQDFRLLGIFYLLLAVLMAGIYNVISRKLSLSFTPVEITFIMMWSGAVFFNILALINHKDTFRSYFSPLFNIQVLIALIYLGLFSSIIAFFLMNYTLSRVEAAQAAVFANLTTVVSILAGVFIRGESFYWFQVLGGLLIIVGVWGTNYYGNLKKRVEELPA
ncbi:DMT family transporter [Natronospora cellulosivora (SeqCode)]